MSWTHVVMRIVACLLIAKNCGAYVTISVPSGPNSTLEGYLCGGTPLSNDTTLLLQSGEHVISAGPFCSVRNLKNIAVAGAGRDQTAVRCGDGGRGFRFSFISNLTLARLTFVDCGLTTTELQDILIESVTSSVVLHLEFSSVSLQQVAIASFNGFGVFGYGLSASALSDVLFQNCAVENCAGALLYATSSFHTVVLQGCVFTHLNSTSIGAALTILGYNNVSLTDCVFKNLTSLQGACALQYAISTVTNCTFQALNGGALRSYFSHVIVINSSFYRNVARYGGALFAYRSEASVVNSAFSENVANYRGGAIDVYRSVASVVNCTFSQNVANYSGGAIDAYYLSQASVVNCIFSQNVANYYGGALHAYISVASVVNCTFSQNVANYSGGAIDAYYLSQASVVNCTFSANGALNGGAINTLNNYYLSISGSMFDGNVATEWGGAVNLFQPVRLNSSLSHSMSVSNCVFTNNAAPIGGAIFIFNSFHLSVVSISQTVLQNNSAPIGAAIYAADFRNNDGSQTYSLILSDLLVKDNHCSSCTKKQEVIGAAIYYTEVSSVILKSYSSKGNQFVGNTPGGAIQGLSGGLHLNGNVLFRNNSGENGGAICILNNGDLYFYPNCNVTFYENTASTFGGALYIQGDPSIPKSKLIECAIHFIGPENYSINFDSNKALLSGQSIYATPIYNCTLEFPDWTNSSSPFIDHPSAYYDHTFNILLAKSNASDIQILSFPVKVLICGCDFGTACDLTSGYKIFTSPGRAVRFNATSVDSENRTSPAVVFTDISPHSQEHRIGVQQNVQWLANKCDTMEFQIYANENVSFNLLLSTFMGSIPTVVQIIMRECDPGFVLTSDSKGFSQCNCSSFLTSLNVACDVNTGTVSRSDNKWIGMYNNGTYNLSAYSYTCPVNYCKSNITQISLATSDVLCINSRQGLRCGHCNDNMSVVFGSSDCQSCSNLWLFTIILYATLGIILVAILFALNLTVTKGTMYGLIFYANIIQVNESIFFTSSYLKPLKIIISFINLDLGFELCFYDGMDDAAKTGLQFVFPTYLLVLTITFIVFCHYCLKSSLSGQCFDRFSRFVGKRAVSVLATLIYLSYSKLLRTVIQILSFATVYTENGKSFRVWFYDGTIRYLEGKHLFLSIIAMIATFFFLFPYTLALTLIPIIGKHSDKNWFFTWLNQKANLVKPMNDAYYAPYKGAWQSWLGVRLWLLVTLYILTSYYSSDQPYLLMYTHSVIMLVFLFAQAHIKPFAKLQGSANSKMKWFFSEFYNWIDSFYMLNYTILAFTASYLLSNNTNDEHLGIAVASLVGLSLIMFLATVLYRTTAAIRSVCMPIDKNKGNVKTALPLSNISTDNIFESMENDKSSPLNTDMHYTIVTENDLREPLMEL